MRKLIVRLVFYGVVAFLTILVVLVALGKVDKIGPIGGCVTHPGECDRRNP